MSQVFMTQLVNSTAIRLIGYESETETLRVLFNHGDAYDYPAVPREVFDALRSAESVGRAFNQAIRNRPASRLDSNASMSFSDRFNSAHSDILIPIAG